MGDSVFGKNNQRVSVGKEKKGSAEYKRARENVAQYSMMMIQSYTSTHPHCL